MQRYDTYKDSGVKWLGEIPGHWESIPLKKCFISSESGLWGDDPKQNDDDAICIRVADFDYSKFSIKTDNLTLRSYGTILSENKKLKKGDLLLEKSGGGELFPVGRVVRYNKDLGKTTCSNFIQKLSPSQNYCSSFLCYLFSSMYTKKVNGLYFNQTTGIQNLKIKEYLNQTVFLPPFFEQTAIANYLDTATAKIDTAIAQQQKMIDLLNERKQIIINKAVTRGLNLNVKMKDSGVEWIGEVPEHWEVRKLKHITKIFGRIGFRGYNASDLVNEGEGAITLSPSNMKDNKMRYEKCSYLSWNKYYESPEIMINNGDVLFVKTGSTYGKSCLVSGLPMEATINPQLVVFKDFECNNEFFSYILQSNSIRYQVELSVIGGTIPTISQEKILNYLAPMPLVEEQKRIVTAIKQKCQPIEDAIIAANKQISLLQERKQIIINEVVTGKVKVV